MFCAKRPQTKNTYTIVMQTRRNAKLHVPVFLPVLGQPGQGLEPDSADASSGSGIDFDFGNFITSFSWFNSCSFKFSICLSKPSYKAAACLKDQSY